MALVSLNMALVSFSLDLFLLHEGSCTPEDNPCTAMPEVTDGGAPVCGSDGVTYINSFALWCTQRKEDPCKFTLYIIFW